MVVHVNRNQKGFVQLPGQNEKIDLYKNKPGSKKLGTTISKGVSTYIDNKIDEFNRASLSGADSISNDGKNTVKTDLLKIRDVLEKKARELKSGRWGTMSKTSNHDRKQALMKQVAKINQAVLSITSTRHNPIYSESADDGQLEFNNAVDINNKFNDVVDASEEFESSWVDPKV